jgi:hypothetical protein
VADLYQLEESTDNYLLEDGSGQLQLETDAGVAEDPMPQQGGGYYPTEG